MKNNSINSIVVGLTGPSGAGKTTVSKIFKQNGFFVINADSVARDVTEREETVRVLTEHFGDTILNDGRLNRRALADIVFSDSNKLKKLNNLLFPIICNEIMSVANSSERQYVLLDAPQLFESGLNKECDKIVSVIAPHDVLIRRVVKRDGISKELAEKRIASQLSEEFFKSNSDYIIETGQISEMMRYSAQDVINDIVGRKDVFEF